MQLLVGRLILVCKILVVEKLNKLAENMHERRSSTCRYTQNFEHQISLIKLAHSNYLSPPRNSDFGYEPTYMQRGTHSGKAWDIIYCTCRDILSEILGNLCAYEAIMACAEARKNFWCLGHVGYPTENWLICWQFAVLQRFYRLKGASS